MGSPSLEERKEKRGRGEGRKETRRKGDREKKDWGERMVMGGRTRRGGNVRVLVVSINDGIDVTKSLKNQQQDKDSNEGRNEKICAKVKERPASFQYNSHRYIHHTQQCRLTLPVEVVGQGRLLLSAVQPRRKIQEP